MSGLQSITYGTIVDAVKNYIKNNCTNIINFGGIPAEFKSGYSTTITISGGNGAATCYCTISITSGNVVQKTATDVDNDMTSYLQLIGASNMLNDNVKDSELLKFINDMVIFCTTKVAFSTSVHNSNRYMIYSFYFLPHIILHRFCSFSGLL